MGKICCIIGEEIVPNRIPLSVQLQLHKELLRAITEGFTVFLSGFGNVPELFFADLVFELRKIHPRLFLEAALPYRSAIRNPHPDFKRLIYQCNGISIHNTRHTNSSLLIRNRQIIAQSKRIFVAYHSQEMKDNILALCRESNKMKDTILFNL